jgi:hypothetical protein
MPGFLLAARWVAGPDPIDLPKTKIFSGLIPAS